MPEWWTYRPEDFLLFSARAYFRMFERHNEAVWPAQVAAVVLGLAAIGLLYRQTPNRARLAAAILAALWAWVGWSFLLRRYAEINWAAGWLAGLFAAESALLLWAGVLRARLRFRGGGGVAARAGVALVLAGMLAYPALAPLLGRSWRQAEVFGIAPDPTAVATLGLLLAAERPRRLLLALPVVWCLLSGVNLWALGSPGFWAPVGAAAVAVVVAAAARRRPASGG